MAIIKSATTYRLQLDGLLKSMLQAWVDYQKAYSTLVGGYGVYDSNRSISALDTIECALSKWLTTICKELSEAYQGGTSKVIELSDLPSTLREFPGSLRRGMVESYRNPDLALWTTLADQLLEQYNFDLLKEKLTVLAEGLEQAGLQELADRLVSNFWLRNHGRENPIKRTKRHIVIESTLYSDSIFGGYSYDTMQKLSLMLAAIRMAAKESGEHRLVPPFEELLQAVESAPNRETIKSGTAFGNKSTIEIKIYHGKFKCFFNPEVLDSLLSFVVINRTPNGELYSLPEAA
ncbi:hypothetical protein K0504_09870 [Neiella marina]|uniref:DUF4942 domain-containing protein n=1 Tax=Neiella holothuriorum TaxID=2870530 RepID=A0ABS7EG71_9GAMM|nr:hypothetical protein [Neiella holothuriorum]MBW8191344.1 hypothetical protein [Neiella holothuriorum]